MEPVASRDGLDFGLRKEQPTGKKFMKRLIALALLIPAIAIAKSPFDGTWKTQLDSMQFSGKPDVYELSGGMYECKSCVPAYKIKADGTDQAVPENGYRDHVAVQVVSPTSIETTAKKAGKVIFTGTMTVSGDGSRLAGKFTSHVGEKTFSGEYTEKRTGPAAAGAHAISGSWQQDSVANMSDFARNLTLESTPNGLKMMWNGQTTDAKFDGKEYLTVGDPGKTMVTLKKISDTQIEETDRREGKVVDVFVYSLAADGKTISVVDTDPVHETKTTYTMDKLL
jgi:hypothetical protein